MNEQEIVNLIDRNKNQADNQIEKANHEISDIKGQISTVVHKIEKSPESYLDFEKMDYELVHKEVIDIKSCRTNIFMGTIGLLGTVGVAILGILGTATKASWELWLPFAASIPTLLLTCAILSSIHKARALSERLGYMEVLGEYLTADKKGKYYSGWIKSQRVTKRCEIYNNIRKELGKKLGIVKKNILKLTSELNQMGTQDSVRKEKEAELDGYKKIQKQLEQEIPEFATCGASNRCSTDARNLVRRVIKRIELRPYFLEGFTSLSTHIYTAAYIISVIALLFATINSLKTMLPNLIGTTYWILVMTGLGVTVVFVALCLYTKHKADKNNEVKRDETSWESETRTEKTFKVYKVIAGMMLPALIIVLFLPKVGSVFDKTATIAAYCLGAAIAATAVSLAYSFLTKVESLRRGRHSHERWRHIWKIRFERCPLMNRPTRPL
jgi:hypothetical protein